MKLNGERLFNLAVLAVLCGFVFMAIDFTPKARLLPLVIGIPSLVLMIILVAADFLKNREPVKKLSDEQLKRQWIMFAGIAGLLAMILVVGLSLAVAIYMLLFLRLVGRMGWAGSVGIAIFAFVLVYGLFGMMLHYPLYKGLLDLV